MHKIINYLIFPLAITFALYTNSICQNNFMSIEYKNELNMPTNLTKAIEIDKAGFVWIATDNGLVKFDGQNFTVFKDQLPSKYVKNIVKLKNGDVLIVSDLGISKIITENNNHQIVDFIKGAASKTDSTIFYPKMVFVDDDNILWISEPDAIVKYENGKIFRFNFDDNQRADSYFRSFLFTKDKYGNLLACSQKGSLFFYDKDLNKFIKLYSFKNKNIRIDAFHKSPSDEILIGTNEGAYNIIYNMKFEDVKVVKKYNINDISIIKNYDENSLLVGTWSSGLFIINKKNGTSKIDGLKFDNISNITIGEAGNIWVASDEGFALITETFFNAINYNLSSFYIENVSKAIDGNIFFTDGNSVYLIDNFVNKPKITNIFNKSESLILCVAGSQNDLWISYRDGYVEHKKNETISRIYLPQTESINRLVRSIVMDNSNSIWATEEGLSGIVKINGNNEYRLYNDKNGINTLAQKVAKDNFGYIYVGGVGSNSFLFYYNPQIDSFFNISKTNFKMLGDEIIVNEIAFDSNNNIWLGTNKGLLYREHFGEIFKKINLNGYPEINIKSLAIDNKDRIWIGFEYGVLLINKGSISKFDTNDGLPNLTATYRSAVIAKNNRLIIGTARGLAYFQQEIGDNNVTNPPIITQIIENNNYNHKSFTDLSFEYNSFFEFSFITLTYPNDKVQYQWRLSGKDTTWSKPTYNTKLVLSQIDNGEHKLQIRSQNTGYLWSKPTEIIFWVNKPWYKSFYFIAFCIIIVIIIVIISIHYSIIIKEKKWIEQKIQSFFKLSSDLIAIISPNGAMVFTNSIWSERLLYLNEELKQINFFDLIPENDLVKVKNELSQLMNSENSISFESGFFNKENMVGFYSWNFSVSADKKYLFGIGRDINEIMQMQSELAELNKNKDKLFSLISHDLRSPFNSLLGYSKMLLDDFNSFTQSEIKEIVESSYKSSKKAFDLLDDLLNWSRIQIDKISVILTEVNLEHIIKDEIDWVSELLVGKNISIELKTFKIMCKIDINSYKVVLRNILTNAIKFSLPNNKIDVILEKIGNNIVLVVTDYGVGISEEKLIRIRENRNNDSSYGTKGEKGSAIGYELINKYAEYNHGKIIIDSKLNKGTTVKFIINCFDR